MQYSVSWKYKLKAKIIIHMVFLSSVVSFFVADDLFASQQFAVENYNQISFSPDGKIIALLYEKYLTPIDMSLRDREIEIHWCSILSPGELQKVKVDTIGDEYARYISIPLDFRFSPDSQKVAVFTPYHLSVINLSTKYLVRINREKERITSFQWLDNNEIGFVVFETKGGNESTKTFWRQNIATEPVSRQQIFQDSTKSTLIYDNDPFYHYPQEFWSTKGRYVIYIYPNYDYLKLLDTTLGNMKTFGSNGSYLESTPFNSVAWRLDESAVFCLGGTQGKRDNDWAYLVQTSDGKVIECTSNSQKTFGEYEPDLEPFWTADGKYIVATHYLGIGPCLIQPNPWNIITFDEKTLEKQLGPKKYPEYKPHLFVMPVANWVGFCAVGYKDSPNHVEAPKYATDYKLQNLIPLFETKGWWAISPDGKTGAVISQRGKLSIHKLDLH